MHRLLILGSLGEFVELVKLARAKGCYTVVCDGYPDGPAKGYADAAYTIAVTETAAIAEICRSERIDGVLTSFSDLLFECMVKIADAAGLPCYLTPEKLPFYRDKFEMKRLLGRLGIGTPNYVCLEKDFPDEALDGFRFPVVTKPLDKYGSRGLFVLDSIAELRAHFDEVCETSEIKKILVEEYNDGCEFNLMSWVHRGKVHIISIADREKTPIETHDIPISSRNVYPSRLLDAVLSPAAEILQRYADAVGQTEGALSMQFFRTPDGRIEVCEIAGRFFGYEHELVEISGGPSIEQLLLDSLYDTDSLEQTLSRLDPHLPNVSATLYFHGRERTIACQDAAETLFSLPGVLTQGTQLFYKDGETVVWHGSKPYAARFYLTGENRDAVDRLTEKIFAQISITDPDGKEILYRNRIPDYR